jgi:hypothetical protein
VPGTPKRSSAAATPHDVFFVSATSDFCGHNPVSSRPRRFNSRGRSHISPGSHAVIQYPFRLISPSFFVVRAGRYSSRRLLSPQRSAEPPRTYKERLSPNSPSIAQRLSDIYHEWSEWPLVSSFSRRQRVVRDIQIPGRRRVALFCEPVESRAACLPAHLQQLDRHECDHVPPSGFVSGQPGRPFSSGVDRQVERGTRNVCAEREWPESER